MVAQAVQVPVSRRVRAESPERWHAALQRAIAHGLEVFQVADTGERMVTSHSRLDTLHRSDGRSCTCEAAAAGDPICQHRAAVRFCLGWLTIPEPAPIGTDCRDCSGCGQRWYAAFAAALPCESCQGTGVKPDHRPQGAPAVEIVALAAD